ncbi:unnamed protein product [Ectocarpus sp. 6 AP-2014]
MRVGGNRRVDAASLDFGNHKANSHHVTKITCLSTYQKQKTRLQNARMIRTAVMENPGFPPFDPCLATPETPLLQSSVTAPCLNIKRTARATLSWSSSAGASSRKKKKTLASA